MEQRERLSERVIIRLTPTERQEVLKLAETHNQTITSFIRDAIINHINYLKNSEKIDNSVE